jgi:subtilisin family serine protease
MTASSRTPRASSASATALAIAAALTSPVTMAGEFYPISTAAVPNSYIVLLTGKTRASVALPALSNARGYQVEQIWEDAINGGLVSGLDEAGARELALQPGVLSVQANGIGETASVQPMAPQQLDRIDQQSALLNGTYTYNFDGTSVHIYILDQPLRASHHEFSGRATIDFTTQPLTPQCPSPDSAGPHGTHVASVAGGVTYGAAKNARIHGITVTGCDDHNFSDATLLAGLNWVAGHLSRPAVLNMSLAVGPSPALDAAVQNLISMGVFITASAGNGGVDACGFGLASIPEVYTVGGIVVGTSDAFQTSYNFGPCVDTFAVASAIGAQYTNDTDHVTMSGTSQAAPMAAGAAALILQQFPYLTPAQVTAQLNARASTAPIAFLPPSTVNRVVNTLPLPSVPQIPPRLTVKDLDCTSPQLVSWDTQQVPERFELERSTSGNFATATQVFNGSQWSFQPDTDFMTYWYFRLRACNGNLCSGYRVGNAPLTPGIPLCTNPTT